MAKFNDTQLGANGDSERCGVLFSGGLDSGVLTHHLLAQGLEIQPFYVRSQLYWEDAELAAARKFLRAIATPTLRPLVVLEAPVGDLYGSHWSVSGRAVPGRDSDDSAVFLPGRNAMLILKAALWCQLNGVARLALAPLGSSPFGDATPVFLERLEGALRMSVPAPLRLWLPFAEMTKQQVMQLGCRAPLQLTFSCLAPVAGDHCGQCNKCAERQRAFREADRRDPTHYDNRLFYLNRTQV